MKLFLILLLCISPFSALFSEEKEYDKIKLEEIKKYLGEKPEELFGTPIDKFIKDLKLSNTEWNYGYTNIPNGELRIYHFDGFCLHVHLTILPKDIEYKNWKSYSSTQKELKDNGIRYLSDFTSYTQIDYIKRADTRMNEYWIAVYKGFQEKAKSINEAKNKNK